MRSTGRSGPCPRRGCGSWCSTCAAIPAACSTWPSRSPSGSSTQGLIVSTRGRAQGQTPVAGRRAARRKWRIAAVRPGRPRQRQCQRDPRRRPSRPPAGDDRRRTDLRQGLGAEHLLAAVGPGRPQADHRQVLLARNRPYSEQGVQPDIPIVVRSAAKPADDAAPPREESIIGDPDLDPVLAAAIRTAKSGLSRAGDEVRERRIGECPRRRPQATRARSHRLAILGQRLCEAESRSVQV